MAEVVVVGAGIGGLAAAARLAKLGHRVVLCERADAIGGLLRPVERDGFCWDTVDSVTLPAVLRDLFRKSGRPIERYLELRLRTPAHRAVFADGTVVDLPTGSRGEQSDAISSGLGRAAAQEWASFVDAEADSWQVLRQQVLEPVDGLVRIAGRDVSRAVKASTSLVRVLRRGLSDPRLRLLAAHGALVAGADPDRLPGQLAVEPYVERTFGVWEIVGGTGRLVDALSTRLAERGVDVRLGCEVVAIEVAEGRAAGVRTADGRLIAADVVVTDLDVRQVLGRMLPPADVAQPLRPWAGADALPGPSVTHLGLRGDLSGLPDEVIWYGDPLVVLRHGNAAPAGHCAVTLLCQTGSGVRTLAAPRGWSALLRRDRTAETSAVGWRGDVPAASRPTDGGPTSRPDVLDLLADRGLDLRSRVVCRIDRSAADVAEAAGGSPYGLGWEVAAAGWSRYDMGSDAPAAGRSEHDPDRDAPADSWSQHGPERDDADGGRPASDRRSEAARSTTSRAGRRPGPRAIAEATTGSLRRRGRTVAERAALATPLPGLYCLGAGLPLPATIPYVGWQAATVATAMGKP